MSRRRRRPGGGVAVYGGASAVPVNFDGTNDYLTRGGDLTGNADSKVFSGSLWFRRGIANTFMRLVNTTGNSIDIFVQTTAGGNNFQVTAENAAGTDILVVTFPAIATDLNWHHVLWSLNLADVGARSAYLDDSAAGISWVTYTDDTMDLATTNYAIGGTPAGGNKWNGDVAEVWMRHGGAVIDFSVESNRRMFITAAGKPAPPSGWPSGGIVALYGALDSWHTNKGSGGGFTENGELTAGTGPVAI